MDDANLEDIKKAFENTEKNIDNKSKPKRKKVGLIVFFVGVTVLVAGLVFFLISIFAKPGLRDAEYLVEVGKWVRDDEPGVIWNFTEVGKGKLTTNNYTNEYDFIWAIENDKLKIETEWLYTLNDEYEYLLDQNAKSLIIKSGEKTIEFVAQETNPQE